MTKTCPHCGSNAVEMIEEEGAEICSECGAVVSESSFQNDPGSRRDGIYGVVQQDQPADWRTKAWNQSVSGNSITIKLKRRVKEQIERSRLPQNLIPQVLEMVQSIYQPTRSIKGIPKCKTPIIASCIYILCRKNGILISYRNVADAARCKCTALLKYTTLISNFFNIPIKEPEPIDVIENIMRQFDVNDPDVKDLANDLYKFCYDTMISTGKQRQLFYIGIVLMCIESIKGHSVQQDKIREVCKQHVCKIRNVRESLNKVKKELLKYGKEIPWINTMNVRNIPKFVPEILSFYEDCQNHSTVNIKCDWQEKKEKREAQKEKRVKNSKQRIEACLKQCSDKPPVSDDEVLHKRCKLSQSTQVEHPQETNLMDEETSHICCAHCCGDVDNCPTYKKKGKTDYCDLNHDDRVIEYLLRKGYTENYIMECNPDSLFCDVFYRLDCHEEREELDDKDICDEEMHLYIKSEQEVQQSEIHTLFIKQNDLEASK